MRFATRTPRPPDTAPPGLTGPARVDRRTSALIPRLRPGDIAVLDHLDLDRGSAHQLVDAGVVAVVNAQPMISGRYANLGPEVLAKAGVQLVDRVGPELLTIVRDGSPCGSTRALSTSTASRPPPVRCSTPSWWPPR